MEDPPVRASLIPEILAELKIEDPKSVFSIVISPGHVIVHGYARNDLDEFFVLDGEPAQWTRAFPIEFFAGSS